MSGLYILGAVLICLDLMVALAAGKRTVYRVTATLTILFYLFLMIFGALNL